MTLPFYRAFEDRYRGARDTIKDRLRAYAPFTVPLLASQPGAPALDLGCGRGEWLELLGEQGFAARGIDLDEGMLAACRERGLAVQNMDALAALRACADGSLAMVSSFHLVEHLPFEVVQQLIAEALRVLQPGGLLVMETPNPENLTVGATSFYMDPTHLHPLPPNLLSFATEHAGFARCKVVRLQEDPRLHGDVELGLITVLEGVSPDYAVVAQKSAAPDTLAAFDGAFATEFGITLSGLAARYQQQLATQHAAIHQILGRLDQQSNAANHMLGQLQQQLATQADQLSTQAQRLIAAEQRADAMGQRVVDLLESSSWRITEPLRRASALARRLNAARREGRIGSAIKYRIKRTLRVTGGMVLRQPRLKRLVRGLLRFTPGLQSRLYALMLDPSAAGNQAVLADNANGLSPRAARVYQELQALQDRNKNAHRH
jgi:O-antigen chain-terminating methyltransferase